MVLHDEKVLRLSADSLELKLKFLQAFNAIIVMESPHSSSEKRVRNGKESTNTSHAKLNSKPMSEKIGDGDEDIPEGNDDENDVSEFENSQFNRSLT